MLLAGRFYDVTPDGQTYHQPAIIDLVRDHWNPIQNPWIQAHFSIVHFSKGPWYVEGAVYALLGRIEPAKGVNALLIVSAFGLCLYSLRRLTRLPFPVALGIAALAAANPVAISQSLSFYVDGQLASLLLVGACSALLMYRQPNRFHAVILFTSVVLAMNVKLTGIVLSGLLCMAVLAATARESRTRAPQFLAVCVCTLGVGALVLGYNPYVTNTLRFANPFYPMAGPNAQVDYADYRPADFNGMGPPERFARSLFARTQWGRTATELKVPFTFSLEEIRNSAYPDPKAGGFGPLFGGALVLSLLFWLIQARRIPKDPLLRSGFLLSAALAATAVVIPEGWLARYVPYVWWVPLIAILVASKGSRSQRLVAAAIAATLVLNVGVVGGYYVYYQNERTTILAKELDRTRQQKQGVVAYLGDFTSNAVRLSEAGITFRETDPASLERLRCEVLFELSDSEARLCLVL